VEVKHLKTINDTKTSKTTNEAMESMTTKKIINNQ